jgi:hypothetical protein
MINYIRKIINGIIHYYGDNRLRARSLKILHPTKKIEDEDVEYWCRHYQDKLLDRSQRSSLNRNVSQWNANLGRIKAKFVACKENLLEFYADDELNSIYPILMTFLQSLLILVPSSAFNERINSILGLVRNSHR